MLDTPLMLVELSVMEQRYQAFSLVVPDGAREFDRDPAPPRRGLGGLGEVELIDQGGGQGGAALHLAGDEANVAVGE